LRDLTKALQGARNLLHGGQSAMARVEPEAEAADTAPAGNTMHGPMRGEPPGAALSAAE
jgi:hypothetical protein